MIDYNFKTGLGTSSLFDYRIFHGFGTKHLGNGTNIQTIEQLIQLSSVEPKHLVIPNQTHSTNVKIVNEHILEKRIIRIPETDALVTNQKNILLTVVTADCVPIIYADIDRSVIAISHGGWSGTLHNISRKVIDQMIEIGAQKEQIVAVIGPSIADCCYEIYGARYDKFKDEFTAKSITSSGSRQYLNLLHANRELLLMSGISEKNIDYRLNCTQCDDTRFWSFHRDHRLTGEMVHFVMLT
ncbi:peptidoglycan editing factor PgeF [Candidatus Roizmanbacteria bacterium CG_4_10_14_0_2_um_filter_39_13]|uniref:Purine nucleoside phosphorylase n=1 Tax=Candidatus Roizmanbacteria bacterium CG_4_10_14_0_2_um_filter_39_13 TaxID=1974825 RepID=A0A2M7U0I3_9BACT|nr:MAG: peptidoglycan editing factor PgeF [Candidatus Roizmanbacteria bacterium CG_4_10_14_0_2_um_filter_39_13]